MKRIMAGSGEKKLEGLISYVLIIGVVTSLLLEIAGLILFYRAYGSLAISHESRMFLQGENFFIFLARLFSGSSVSWPIRVITLGIAVLILTPYVRAMLSVIYFAARGNGKYLVITLFVFTILTISLLVH
jgi:uncharacterized membrane protein